jgi:hypothetical protein
MNSLSFPKPDKYPPAPPPRPRKIVGIAAATEASGGDAQVFALCDDGTTWMLVNGTWHELPAIPQPEGNNR